MFIYDLISNLIRGFLSWTEVHAFTCWYQLSTVTTVFAIPLVYLQNKTIIRYISRRRTLKNWVPSCYPSMEAIPLDCCFSSANRRTPLNELRYSEGMGVIVLTYYLEDVKKKLYTSQMSSGTRDQRTVQKIWKYRLSAILNRFLTDEVFRDVFVTLIHKKIRYDKEEDVFSQQLIEADKNATDLFIPNKNFNHDLCGLKNAVHDRINLQLYTLSFNQNSSGTSDAARGYRRPRIEGSPTWG